MPTNCSAVCEPPGARHQDPGVSSSSCCPAGFSCGPGCYRTQQRLCERRRDNSVADVRFDSSRPPLGRRQCPPCSGPARRYRGGEMSLNFMTDQVAVMGVSCATTSSQLSRPPPHWPRWTCSRCVGGFPNRAARTHNTALGCTGRTSPPTQPRQRRRSSSFLWRTTTARPGSAKYVPPAARHLASPRTALARCDASYPRRERARGGLFINAVRCSVLRAPCAVRYCRPGTATTS